MLNVLLVANYAPDNQQSMDGIARIFAEELPKRGFNTRIARPEPVFLTEIYKNSPLAKWLGYLDKYLLFPLALTAEADWADVVHVVDHSNALYLPFLADKAKVVTCNDLLAVRSGLGEDTYCPLTRLGKFLQRLILNGLKKADVIICISHFTKGDAERLVNNGVDISAHYLSLNYPFRVMEKKEAAEILAQIKGLNWQEPYLLHVGSGQPRKNREGVMRTFALLKDEFPGQLVFAGSPLTAEQNKLAAELELTDRIVEATDIHGETLVALYSCAFALLFPSYTEGLGWPIIEAQACGCPVIASTEGPCPEAAGQGALVHAPDDHAAYAQSVRYLMDEKNRQEKIKLGFANLPNFDTKSLVEAYIEAYGKAINKHKSTQFTLQNHARG